MLPLSLSGGFHSKLTEDALVLVFLKSCGGSLGAIKNKSVKNL